MVLLPETVGWMEFVAATWQEATGRAPSALDVDTFSRWHRLGVPAGVVRDVLFAEAERRRYDTRPGEPALTKAWQCERALSVACAKHRPLTAGRGGA